MGAAAERDAGVVNHQRRSVGGMTVKVLFLGDVVGSAGREAVTRLVPAVRQARGLDVVLANVENATNGSGLNTRSYNQLAAAGIAGMTMGDHAYKNREIFRLFERGAAVCRPANYPDSAAGPRYLLVPMAADRPQGPKLALCVLQGRMFMRPVDCPLRAADRLLAELAALPEPPAAVFVDIHAEATSEKQTLGRYLAGRVTAVLGTHTHVPTADASLYPPGTAYITDVGMTGPYGGIIGREIAPVTQAALDFEPVPFTVAEADPRLSGALVTFAADTGRASAIELVHLPLNASV